MASRKKVRVPHSQDDRPVTSLEALYTELSQELFGGHPLHHVNEVAFEWKTLTQMKSAFGNILMKWERGPNGRFHPIRGSVKILIQSGMTHRQTRKIVAHEMAHLAAAIEDGSLKHNAAFWRVMEGIGYGKHHRFEGADAEERDIYTQKSEERKAVWFWRKQPVGTPVRYQGQRGYMLAAVQKRGTLVRITNGRGFFWWVAATFVKPDEARLVG